MLKLFCFVNMFFETNIVFKIPNNYKFHICYLRGKKYLKLERETLKSEIFNFFELFFHILNGMDEGFSKMYNLSSMAFILWK